jgi:hypothetical protein
MANLSTRRKRVAAVQEKVAQLTEKKILGLFKSDRENDILSGALSNAEHTRRIRGVASQMLWKVGFSNDAWSYKKRDRYKRNLEDVIKEKMNSILRSSLDHTCKVLPKKDRWTYSKLLKIRHCRLT